MLGVLLDAVFDCLLQALSRDERIEIRGFGSFETRHYRARKGRNPRTGAPVQVKPKRLPYFKVGKELRDRIATACTPPASCQPWPFPARRCSTPAKKF